MILSFHLFAKLSVRINAIIPPRATELRFLSSSAPIIVKFDNISEFKQVEQNILNQVEEEDDALAEEEALARSRNATDEEILSLRRRRKPDSDGDITPIILPPNKFSASRQDVREYFNNIMSCMQDFQLHDFTSAIKSCMSESVAFIHIDGDRYYQIIPRYPFVYVNEYLQDIPSAEFRSGKGVDWIDWMILAFFILAAVCGFIATMQRIKLSELCSQSSARRVFCCWSMASSRPRMDSDSYRPSSPLPQTKSRSVFMRVWGVMVGYRHQHAYSQVPQQEEQLELGQVDGSED